MNEYAEKICVTEDKNLAVDAAFQRYTEKVKLSENTDVNADFHNTSKKNVSHPSVKSVLNLSLIIQRLLVRRFHLSRHVKTS